MTIHTFPCGCSFPTLSSEDGFDGGFGVPLLDLDIEQVPLDCPATWELLGRGDTVGCFQLEKKLGQEWSRRLRPDNIEHLAALTGLLRPGPLNGRDEHGVSMTEHYCLRKNGEEPVESVHPAIDPILSKTYNVVVYQEGLLLLSGVLAGFDLLGRHRVQKGVAKKDAKLLAEIKKDFLEACDRLAIVPPETARMVWSWIEAAGRYSFPKAHALAYGIISYWTAWAKTHHPVAFFTAWLASAHLKKSGHLEEVQILVEDARRFGVEVFPPDARVPHAHFYTDRARVYFGLADVKGVGVSQADFLRTLVESGEGYLGKSVRDWSWFEFFLFCLTRLNARTSTALVRSGACDFAGLPRARMLAELDAWGGLTDSEKGWVRAVAETRVEGRTAEDYRRNLELNRAALEEAGEDEREDIKETLKEDEFRLSLLTRGLPEFHDLEGALLALSRPAYKRPRKKTDPEPTGPFGGCHSPTREGIVRDLALLLQSPPSPLVDTSRRIVLDEEELLGVAVTRHRLDQVDLTEANVTVGEFLAGKSGRLLFGVEVAQVRPTETKKGKKPGSKMARLTLKDRTGTLEAVCFPEEYEKIGPLLRDGALLLVHGERDKKQPRTLIVKAAWAPR